MNNQPLIKNVSVLVLFLFIPAFLLAGCSAKAQDQSKDQGLTATLPSNANRDTTVYIVPGKKEAEGVKSMMESDRFNKISTWGRYINQGIGYEQAGKYEQAEVEFKKAIEVDKNDQGVPRRGLARVYEATGQYQLALEQINWLIQRTSRKDVLDELIVRKQNLEKLLATKNRTNV